MSNTAVVADAPGARTVPLPKVPTEIAQVLARDSDRRPTRHRMQRAARIYTGKTNLRDKIATYPDKGWALLVLSGTALVTYALGCATILVVESVL